MFQKIPVLQLYFNPGIGQGLTGAGGVLGGGAGRGGELFL